MIFVFLLLPLVFGALPQKNVDAKSAEKPPGLSVASIRTPVNRMQAALLRYQEYFGLKQTGELDSETKKLMSSPLCANSDASGAALQAVGVAEANQKVLWNKTTLLYFIENTSDELPIYVVRQAMDYAFGLWSQVVRLDFQEARTLSQADIRVKFGKGDRGDPWPFDGKGGVFAHAAMPRDGRLHFDDDENWAFMDTEKILSESGLDIIQLAIHESGHVIGVEHIQNRTAMMYPYYGVTKDARGNYVVPTLSELDIKAVLELYPARPTSWGRGGNGGNRGGWGWGNGQRGGGGGWNGGWNPRGGGWGPGRGRGWGR